MLTCNESDGTIQRTVSVTIKPTTAEIADAIWNLDTTEQICLLGYLKRRFCNSGEGLLQMASVANELHEMPAEKSDEVHDFVRCLADYVLGQKQFWDKVSEI